MRLLSPSFTHEGNTYTLELGVDAAALRQGDLSIPVIAKRVSPDGEVFEVEATLTLEPDEERIVIEIGGVIVGYVELNELLEVETEYPTDDGQEGFSWSDFVALVVPEGRPIDEVIEEAIMLVPAGDPALGCLLKAGIASTAGQVARCYYNSRGFEGRIQHVRAIARCLGANSSRIFWATSKRTFNCILRLGF